jgi:hypothetical protein
LRPLRFVSYRIPVPGKVNVQYRTLLTDRVNLINPGNGDKLQPIPLLLKLILKKPKLIDLRNCRAIGIKAIDHLII